MVEERVKSSIQVISRMMILLDTLALQTKPVNLKQLAAESQLHPSTAYRILNVMVQHRLVERIERGTYRLGMRLLELGTLVGTRAGGNPQSPPVLIHPQFADSGRPPIRHNDDAS